MHDTLKNNGGPAGNASVLSAGVVTHQSVQVEPSGDAPSLSPPPYPNHTLPADFPVNCVFDPLISPADYVDTKHPFRVGVLYSKVPKEPLRPTYIPSNADGSKTFFYCVTIGLKVGIVTDPAVASAHTNGVSGFFSKKRHSQSAALAYFNEDLKHGKVRIGSLRKSRRPFFDR